MSFYDCRQPVSIRFTPATLLQAHGRPQKPTTDLPQRIPVPDDPAFRRGTDSLRNPFLADRDTAPACRLVFRPPVLLHVLRHRKIRRPRI